MVRKSVAHVCGLFIIFFWFWFQFLFFSHVRSLSLSLSLSRLIINLNDARILCVCVCVYFLGRYFVLFMVNKNYRRVQQIMIQKAINRDKKTYFLAINLRVCSLYVVFGTWCSLFYSYICYGVYGAVCVSVCDNISARGKRMESKWKIFNGKFKIAKHGVYNNGPDQSKKKKTKKKMQKENWCEIKEINLVERWICICDTMRCDAFLSVQPTQITSLSMYFGSRSVSQYTNIV